MLSNTYVCDLRDFPFSADRATRSPRFGRLYVARPVPGLSLFFSVLHQAHPIICMSSYISVPFPILVPPFFIAYLSYLLSFHDVPSSFPCLVPSPTVTFIIFSCFINPIIYYLVYIYSLLNMSLYLFTHCRCQLTARRLLLDYPFLLPVVLSFL